MTPSFPSPPADAAPLALDDFLALALSLREPVTRHGVAAEHRASLIEDIVFQVASFLDARLGGHFHESIYDLLEGHGDALGESPLPAKAFIAQLEVAFAKGRPKALNVLDAHLREPRVLREGLELALGLRGLDEVGAEIDTDARFESLLRIKGGIEALRFNPAELIDAPSWIVVPLSGSTHGDFEASLGGLCDCVWRVAAPWR